MTDYENITVADVILGDIITLPDVDADARHWVTGVSEPNAPIAPMRILQFDDDPTTTNMLRLDRAIQRWGHQGDGGAVTSNLIIESASTLEEASAAVTERATTAWGIDQFDVSANPNPSTKIETGEPLLYTAWAKRRTPATP